MIAILDELTDPRLVDLDAGADDLTHTVCDCMLLTPGVRQIAMCGLDVTEDELNLDPPPEEECVVCRELDEANVPCARCGR
jgi:hypothetical protein